MSPSPSSAGTQLRSPLVAPYLRRPALFFDRGWMKILARNQSWHRRRKMRAKSAPKSRRAKSLLGAGLILGVVSLSLALAQTKVGDVSIGTKLVFKSSHLGGEIPVRIHLPSDYAKGESRYPVSLSPRNRRRFCLCLRLGRFSGPVRAHSRPHRRFDRRRQVSGAAAGHDRFPGKGTFLLRRQDI